MLQTLVGAVLGGVLALVGGYLVRRREARDAARRQLLLEDLPAMRTQMDRLVDYLRPSPSNDYYVDEETVWQDGVPGVLGAGARLVASCVAASRNDAAWAGTFFTEKIDIWKDPANPDVWAPDRRFDDIFPWLLELDEGLQARMVVLAKGFAGREASSALKLAAEWHRPD